MYEIIVVDGWPAFRKPDGTIRPFIGGGDETPTPTPSATQRVGGVPFGTPPSPTIREFGGVTKALKPGGDPTNINDWVDIFVTPPKPTTFDFDLKSGLIFGSNGQVYIPDETQTGGKRLATNEEIAAARTAATVGSPRYLLPEEKAHLEAQTASLKERDRIAGLTEERLNQELALNKQNAAYNQDRKSTRLNSSH